MKLRWAVALLALAGLGATSARASGFGFTVAGATVNNFDTNGNNRADVGEIFTVTGAPFSSYLSSGAAPAINDNDLNRYTASLTGTAVEVNGNEVRYSGTFRVTYTGPAYPAGVDVETGTADFWAVYDNTGAATMRGLFLATQGVPAVLQSDPNFSSTDFAPYNTGRFYATYAPTPGNPATGTLTANLNAGRDGFAASLHNATLTNNDANGNLVADVGETFTLDAPIAAYYPQNADAMLPLNDNDLTRYRFIINATVTSVIGRSVVYNGTYALRYTGPAYPTGVDVETGNVRIDARFNEINTGAAKLTGTLVATAGVPAALQSDPNFKNSDFAVFNPGRFEGTYLPATIGAASGTVSGTLAGGVLGFSATVGNGAINNGDENSDGNADEGETFTASGPLSAYMAVGAPPLLDKDLNLYTINLNGTVTNVTGTVVTYAGNFNITYAGPALTATVETGIFTIVATYNLDGTAELTGTLRADPGAAYGAPPFEVTDYAPFNPASFTGFYTSNGPTGTFYGGLTSGALVQSVVSRKLGATIEGSPTAATGSNDVRYALAVSGTTLYVLDPETGRDVAGWQGGKALDGTVIGRPAVLDDQVYVGTNAGTLYRFHLLTGALLNSGQPGGAGSRILTAPAPVEAGAVDQVVVAYSTASGSAIVRVAADNLGTPTAGPQALSPGAITTSSPAVPQNGNIFVGSNAGLFVLDYTTLAVKLETADSTPTSPLVVGNRVWLATGNGAALRVLNASTLAQEAAYNLQSPLILSAFYDKPNNLVYAGVHDGRVVAFEPAGAYAGLVLPGLFNPENTGNSFAMPVSANRLMFRATENKQILFGLPLNGDEQDTIDLVSPVRGAVSATGQMPGSDFVIGTSSDGFIHMFSLPGVDVPTSPAPLVFLPMDQQINKGILTNNGSPLGDAIYVPPAFNETLSFVTEGGETFTRVSIAGGSWWYGPYIDFRLAGIGALDLSQGDYTIEFDTRYFQPEDNTNRYADAPVFVRFFSIGDDNNTELGRKDFGIVYATQAPLSNPAYPEWTHVKFDWSAANATNVGTNVYDPTKIGRMRLYGTDWFSPANQFKSFVDVKNIKITPKQ